MGTRQSIQINGVPIKLNGGFERDVTDESGSTMAELEAVVIVRGRLQNKQFMQLLAAGQLRIDLASGDQEETMYATVANHAAVASGSGESMVYRHDILFRELPDSYARRKAQRAAVAPVVEAPRPTPRTATATVERDPDETISRMYSAANTAVLNTALRQLKGEAPPVIEEPLTVPELAGIESVLINLRVEALIDALEAAGVLRRGAVNMRFRALLNERFVSEAIPLVGEKAARQAARDIIAGAE